MTSGTSELEAHLALDLRAPLSDPLELARAIGKAIMGTCGSFIFEELELAYASRVQDAHFTENPKLRPYQNIGLYWTKGYLKNTMLEHFAEVLPDKLHFPNREVKGGSAQVIFGGISDDKKRIIKPLFLNQNMIFIPELMCFLGQGDEQREKTDLLNEAVEGKTVIRNILKFGSADPDILMPDENLFFDGETLSYQPQCLFAIASRPLPPRTWSYLEGSGFWSRFHMQQLFITDAVAKELFTGSMAPMDEGSEFASLKTILQKFNTSLYQRYHDKTRRMPDYENLICPLLQNAAKKGEELGADKQMNLADVIDIRVKGDLIREVYAYQVLYPDASNETVKAWMNLRLNHFFDFIVTPQLDFVIEEKRAHPKVLQDAIVTVQTLFAGKTEARETILEALQKLGFYRATIDRALQSRVFKRVDRGMYEIPPLPT